MDVAAYVSALEAAAAQTGIPLMEGLAPRLAAHQALVDKWARRINLTTVTDPRAAAVKHGLDCLLFTRFVPEGDETPTVDVGSGGGYPGLVLALARPSTPLFLLEPIRKRCSFLRTAAAELGLSNVRVIEGRLAPAEAGPPAARIPWPVGRIVSRATIPPLDLVPLAAPFLAPGGALLVTGGQGAPEVEALRAVAPAGLRHVERHAFTLPGAITRVLDRFENVG